MQTKTEFLIWDKIVNSAKKRFDYDLYANKFKNQDPDIFDKLVLHIIVGFASGECHETISTNLHNELQHVGVEIRDQIIDTIVQDKHIVFSGEIYAAYLTFSMLEDGHSEIEILGYVTDLLESPKVY
ncbi:hypothetical protein [Sphingobacterium paucimobilis]|uniref:Uncharacterized protein n=1 Tax=Sphingobacterium paucimobilis HER1398 TaxID=1346330 RepID=U2J3T9_9SPHI|nr:hypothetical protein [Sphingobacterium paucimobilis]ERJ59589.1 hypothetical protein M472_12485 [Sphingobacterium paucimobilis HER1398]